MLVEVIRLREGGIKLTASELAPAQRGYLRIARGVARLTHDTDSPTTVGDVIPPLDQCRLHRWSASEVVLHGVEQPLVDRFRIGPPQLQAWVVRLRP
jgi:hypothetical protein